ncbi:Hypothetical predicted protein [Olea europaea subsp. europaea]|uniref:Uncharacterized protein n=1 Tax=Olea europaea subsp. europaea TaxID=158383 RepID=A0A8S0V5N0_OLEEU|nr:Hypothetical predicted protein [Olea europaea subsp. europaea]
MGGLSALGGSSAVSVNLSKEELIAGEEPHLLPGGYHLPSLNWEWKRVPKMDGIPKTKGDEPG